MQRTLPESSARRLSVVLALAIICLVPACFGNESSEFPAGLAPLEDNTAPLPAPLANDDYPEQLTKVFGQTARYHWGHARGYVHASAADVWAAIKDPLVTADRRNADRLTFELNTEPEYDYGFLLHYFVDEIVNVEWDELWRFGVIAGTEADLDFGITRWQKVWGTTFIELIEGTLIVKKVDETTTQIELVEHISATQTDSSTIGDYFDDVFASILARLAGQPLPTY